MWDGKQSRRRVAEEVRAQELKARREKRGAAKKTNRPNEIEQLLRRQVPGSEEALDITDHKRGEDELRKAHEQLEERVRERTAELEESYERFTKVLDSLDALVYVVDMETYEVLFVNKYGRDIWGDMSGKICWQSLQSGQAGPCEFCTNDRLVGENGEPKDVYKWEFKNTVVDRWYECRDQAIKWTDGRLVRLEIATDITDRKRAEDMLRFTQFSVDNAADAAFWMGPDARLIYVNDAACRSLGYSRDELLSMSVHDIDPCFPREVWPAHWSELKERGSFVVESKHRAQNGRVFPVEVCANYLTFEGNEYNCAFVRDITERKRAEEQIAIFRKFAEASEQGMGMADLECNITYANATLCRFLGIENPEDACGTNVADYYSKEDLPRLQEEILPAVMETGHHAVEMPVMAIDGSVTPCIQSLFAIRDDHGKPLCLANVITDITERKKFELALRESEEKYRRLYEGAPLGYQSLDASGNFLDVNKKWLDDMGYSKEEVIGRCFAEFVAPDYVELFEQRFPRLKAEGKTRGAEFEMVRKDESRMLVSIDGNAEYYEEGKFKRTHCIMHDITERRLAEEELRRHRDHLEEMVAERTDELERRNEELQSEIAERRQAQQALWMSEEKFREFVEGTSALVTQVDSKGLLTYVNRMAKDVFGLEPEQCVGLSAFSFIHPDDRAGTEEYFAQWVRDKVPNATFENRQVSRGGQVRDMLWTINMHFDDEGDVSYINSIARDITDLRQAEERARQRQAELVHVSRLSTIGDMASGLAHELNQPLCAIMTCSEMCLHMSKDRDGDIERLNESLELIVSQTERAGEIIRRIRDFVKKQETCRTSVDINDVVRETISLIDADIRHSETVLDLDFSKRLPMVLGDTIQIEQVLLNLVRNAIEAMQSDDSAERRLTIKTSAQSSEEIEVAVCDTGPGMEPEVLEKLFDSFYTTKPDGLGIGLSICRSIIEAHNGELWAKVNPKGGSTFTFTLPTASSAQ